MGSSSQGSCWFGGKLDKRWQTSRFSHFVGLQVGVPKLKVSSLYMWKIHRACDVPTLQATSLVLNQDRECPAMLTTSRPHLAPSRTPPTTLVMTVPTKPPTPDTAPPTAPSSPDLREEANVNKEECVIMCLHSIYFDLITADHCGIGTRLNKVLTWNQREGDASHGDIKAWGMVGGGWEGRCVCEMVWCQEKTVQGAGGLQLWYSYIFHTTLKHPIGYHYLCNTTFKHPSWYRVLQHGFQATNLAQLLSQLNLKHPLWYHKHRIWHDYATQCGASKLETLLENSSMDNQRGGWTRGGRGSSSEWFISARIQLQLAS